MDLPLAEVERLLALNEKTTISIDSPVSNEVDKPLLDTLDDKDQGDPASIFQDEDIKRHLDQWLDELTDKQKDVIMRRFGLGGFEVSTLEKTGEDIGLTRERVRQIQSEAIRKLREIIASKIHDPKILYDKN